MLYRDDYDLEFLQKCENDDLGVLVDYLTRNRDGDPRWTEQLTDADLYKRFFPNHRWYWKEIAAQVQTFGANSIGTMFRGGKGVLYRKVLTGVCKKMKVNYSGNSSTELIESNLLMKILTESLEHMDSKQLKELVQKTGLKTTNFSAQAVTIALQATLRAGGFATYQMAVIVANAVARAVIGRGLTLAANSALTRTIGVFLGPVGWIVTVAWTVIDVAGPAYRITIPAVIQISYMRAKLKMQEENQQREERKRLLGRALAVTTSALTRAKVEAKKNERLVTKEIKPQEARKRAEEGRRCPRKRRVAPPATPAQKSKRRNTSQKGKVASRPKSVSARPRRVRPQTR